MHRVLVDPHSLKIVDPMGSLEKQKPSSSHRRSSRRRLNEPKPDAGSPRGGTPIRLYSELDKESVGVEILRKLFSSDDNNVADLWAQRGVGADAVDELRRFYELKVSAGTEPDHVTLTDAEVERALTTPDFFLVIVSNVEGVDARPKVRVIVDPVRHLQTVPRGAITLSGIRSATSLTYDFAQIDVNEPAGVRDS